MRRDLVEAASRGDHEAFEVLTTSAGDRLYAVAHLILRQTDLAEDAVQEALVRAWQQLPSLRDPDRFDAWLYRLVREVAREPAPDVDRAGIVAPRTRPADLESALRVGSHRHPSRARLGRGRGRLSRTAVRGR